MSELNVEIEEISTEELKTGGPCTIVPPWTPPLTFHSLAWPKSSGDMGQREHSLKWPTLIHAS